MYVVSPYDVSCGVIAEQKHPFVDCESVMTAAIASMGPGALSTPFFLTVCKDGFTEDKQANLCLEKSPSSGDDTGSSVIGIYFLHTYMTLCECMGI